MVVGLILITMIGSISVLFIAQWDGGANIVDNYYQKTIDWDKTVAEKAKSQQLGWQLSTSLATTADGHHKVRFQLLDKAGKPVTGAKGTVAVARPSDSKARFVQDLWADGDAYAVILPLRKQGNWDFELRFTKADAVYVEKVRLDIMP